MAIRPDKQTTPDQPSRMQKIALVVMVAAAIGSLVLEWLFVSYNQVDAIPYSQFETLVAEGSVTEVTVSSETIHGKVRDKLPSGKSAFVTARVDPALAEKLAKKDVVVTGVPAGGLLQSILGWVAPLLMFLLVWYWLSRRQGGVGGFMSIGKSRAKVYAEKETKVSFADVAGVDEAKFELQEVVSFLKDPGSYGRLGAHVPKGILLVGPPGTGKTLLARAVAGEAGGAVLLHFRLRVCGTVRGRRRGART